MKPLFFQCEVGDVSNGKILKVGSDEVDKWLFTDNEYLMRWSIGSELRRF